MKLALDVLKEEYTAALRDYVARGEESALQQAFDLGRRAIKDEPSVLDITAIHHEALARLLRETPDASRERVLQEASEFLMQAISPFEMTHRGFQETNARLRELNETLERRVEERTEELARSNAELQQFAYIASHDLQEPLRMVTSYMQLLTRRYGDRLDGDAREFIGFAVDGAARMNRLIQDLLAFSRVGTRGREFTPTDCNEVLEMARMNLKVAIEETGARVTSDPLPTVMGDDTQLVQLFQNLISNAIKFTKDRTPEVRVGVQSDEAGWLFSVSDNGIGMERRHLDKVFTIFQRLHTRDEYAGTGIGLAVCRKIVERHGGRIWAESEPGEGSTFYFTLPADGEGDRR